MWRNCFWLIEELVLANVETNSISSSAYSSSSGSKSTAQNQNKLSEGDWWQTKGNPLKYSCSFVKHYIRRIYLVFLLHQCSPLNLFYFKKVKVVFHLEEIRSFSIYKNVFGRFPYFQKYWGCLQITRILRSFSIWQKIWSSSI
jgi:hypothetical protein